VSANYRVLEAQLATCEASNTQPPNPIPTIQSKVSLMQSKHLARSSIMNGEASKHALGGRQDCPNLEAWFGRDLRPRIVLEGCGCGARIAHLLLLFCQAHDPNPCPSLGRHYGARVNGSASQCKQAALWPSWLRR